MPDQQDSPSPTPDEGGQQPSRPVRRTDDERWLASWERFESASLDGAPAAAWPDPVNSKPGPPPRPEQQRSAGPRHYHPEPRPEPKAPASPAPASPALASSPASAADLTSQTLLRPRAVAPERGWRRLVHTATRGAVKPGLSPAERQREQLIRRILTPVRGCHRIAVVSLKGGIGKTTTTACLGLALAHYRGDRVVAIDANPDAGTLAERLTGRVDVTVRDLLDGIDGVRSFPDISSYTSLADRLQVLASEQDPEMSHAFDEEQYRAVAEVLARYFNIVLTDSGTGLLHSAMAGTLAVADSLVVVGAPSVDGASRAAKTLDWLVAHGHGDLVSRSVAVISSVRPANGDVDMSVLRDHFGARCRAVVEVPYDPHLAAGGMIDMTELKAPTTAAMLTLAASVADGFAVTR